MTTTAMRLCAGFLVAPLLPLAIWAVSPSGFNVIAFVQGLPGVYALALGVGIPLWLLLRRLNRLSPLPVVLCSGLLIALAGTVYQAWHLRRALYVRQRERDLVLDGQLTSDGLNALLAHAVTLSWLAAIGGLAWWLIVRARR